MEHPDITRAELTGYPVQDERYAETVEDHPIEDFFGSEIQEGDKYFKDGAGRTVLEENIDDYLIEVVGVTFYRSLDERK